jgi:hypothetical protein
LLLLLQGLQEPAVLTGQIHSGPVDAFLLHTLLHTRLLLLALHCCLMQLPCQLRSRRCCAGAQLLLGQRGLLGQQ